MNEKLMGEDLLRVQNAKGKICISVIVPTHRTSPERRADEVEVKGVVEKAKVLLRNKYGQEETAPLVQALDELFEKIDFVHNREGLGLYVSEKDNLLVQFSFPMEEKVVVGERFEIRDLLYKTNYSLPYYILSLTKKGAKLFEGKWDEVEEIKSSAFPMEYADDYAYAKPVRSSSFAGYSHVKMFEKDKSELEKIRFSNFFHEVDKALGPYLMDNIPFIVLGDKREIASFTNQSLHIKNVIGVITGNYDHADKKTFSGLAWPVMLAHLKDEREQMIKDFEEKIGAHLGISGIQDIWNAAEEGRALTLLAEKDFRCPGFLLKNDQRLYLLPPKKDHRILTDAVDDLIEKVLDKQGHVYFVDNDRLKDYGRLALITRY